MWKSVSKYINRYRDLKRAKLTSTLIIEQKQMSSTSHTYSNLLVSSIQFQPVHERIQHLGRTFLVRYTACHFCAHCHSNTNCLSTLYRLFINLNSKKIAVQCAFLAAEFHSRVLRIGIK